MVGLSHMLGSEIGNCISAHLTPSRDVATNRGSASLGSSRKQEASMKRRGWVVTLAGMGLNLALGILYAWSVFSKQLTEPVSAGGFGWTKTQATLPYTLAIACFALTMIPAGRLQDRLGPMGMPSGGGGANHGWRPPVYFLSP